MRRVLIVSHTGRPDAVRAQEQVEGGLRARGLHPVRDLSEDGAEIGVVLGGDGTILRAAQLVRGRDIPLIGINLGHVGFLAEAEVEEIAEVVERIAERQYTVEERITVEVSVRGPDGVITTGWAINEASIEKWTRDRMIEVSIGVDGRGLSTFGCDGVVIATPTGSTAYAFSGGGPIVWPDVDALLLVPISAHALFARPLVVGPGSVFGVEILTRSRSGATVWCDGRRAIEAPPGSSIEVRRGSEPVRLARLHQAPFTQRLVGKFNLPVTGWRGPDEAP